jgi:predicted dehydrogenase
VQHLREGRLVAAASVIRFPNGGHGLVATCLEAGRWGESYALHGGGASLYIRAFSEVRLLTAEGEQVWRESGGDWTPMLQARGFAAQIQHFFDCVQSRQQPLTLGWEAFKTQRLVEDLVACVQNWLGESFEGWRHASCRCLLRGLLGRLLRTFGASSCD